MGASAAVEIFICEGFVAAADPVQDIEQQARVAAAETQESAAQPQGSTVQAQESAS